MIKLPSWISRVTALLLLAAVGVSLYAFVAAPLLATYGETDRRQAQVLEQLAQFEAMAQVGPAYEAQLAELDQRLMRQGLTLDGATDAIAAAKLQDRLGAVVTKAGGDLRANQSLPAESEGRYRKIGVRVQASVTTAQLAKVLYDLEAGRPFVFLDALEVKARPPRRRNQEQANSEPVLRVRFDAYSFQPADGGS